MIRDNLRLRRWHAAAAAAAPRSYLDEVDGPRPQPRQPTGRLIANVIHHLHGNTNTDEPGRRSDRVIKHRRAPRSTQAVRNGKPRRDLHIHALGGR